MPSTEPCKICGCTDMQMLDGFYYCLECGTQDVNVRETLIEYHNLEDGNRAHLHTKKIYVLDSKINPDSMSLQWHRWHTYNFVIIGLADELLELGAKPSFKMKLLWIWTEYVKKFRKSDLELDKREENIGGNLLNLGRQSFFNKPDELSEDIEDKLESNQMNKQGYDISICTLSTLVAMLYVALNLDESEIQLGDLCRFIREQRLSVRDFMKFIPKELKCHSIDHWDNFVLSKHKIKSPRHIRRTGMKLFKHLDLGVPFCPNLHALIRRYLTELNMPSEFEALVFSLIKFVPINLNVDQINHLEYIPDYEGFAMAYIIMSFKMSFGLDDKYECDLSDAIAEINFDHGYDRCYKNNNLFINQTSRYFSYRDWSKYIAHRIFTISKYFLPMAIIDDCNDVTDHVFISSTKERLKLYDSAKNLSDDITMKLLNKLFVKIGLKESPIAFPPSLTPITTYSEMILPYLGDEDIKDSFSEDFSCYSLKYITQDFKLEFDLNNVFTGVSLNNKKITKKLNSKCLTKRLRIDKKKVIVVNNKNVHSEMSRVKNVKLRRESDILVAELEIENLQETCEDYSSSAETFTSTSVNAYDEKFDVDDEILMRSEIESNPSNISNIRIDNVTSLSNEDIGEEEASKFNAIDHLLRRAHSKFSLLNVTFPATRKRKPNTQECFGDGLISSLITPRLRKRKSLETPAISNTVAISNLDESLNEYFKSLFNNLRNDSHCIGDDTENIIEVSHLENNTLRDEQDQTNIEDGDLLSFNQISADSLGNDCDGDSTIKITVDIPAETLTEDNLIDQSNHRKEKNKRSAELDIVEDKEETDEVSLEDDFPYDANTELLLENIDSVGLYYYWFKHFNRDLKVKCPNLFENELSEHFPKSFAWLLRLCASMIEANTISLYNNLTFLENILRNNVCSTSSSVEQ